MGASSKLSLVSIDGIPTAREVLQKRVLIPDGVKIQALNTIQDSRGTFTELFREEWKLGPGPVQWNVTLSEANVLRGVHVHRSHVDYLSVVLGEMVLCLHDVRRNSPTYRRTTLLRLQSHDLHLAMVPVGVAHGFYFSQPACMLYSVSSYFDGSDEFGCRWNELELGVSWPCQSPVLSDRDKDAGSYSEMIAALNL